MALQTIIAKAHLVVAHFQHRAHLCAECTYLSAVSIEAHGMYAYAAMALLVVTLVGVIVNVSGE